MGCVMAMTAVLLLGTHSYGCYEFWRQGSFFSKSRGQRDDQTVVVGVAECL